MLADHSGQGLHAKDLRNKEWRGWKIVCSQRGKLRLEHIHDWNVESVSSSDADVVNCVSTWHNKRDCLFMPCLCGFLSNMTWASSFTKLQNSNKFLLLNYYLATGFGWGKEADIIGVLSISSCAWAISSCAHTLHCFRIKSYRKVSLQMGMVYLCQLLANHTASLFLPMLVTAPPPAIRSGASTLAVFLHTNTAITLTSSPLNIANNIQTLWEFECAKHKRSISDRIVEKSPQI